MIFTKFSKQYSVCFSSYLCPPKIECACWGRGVETHEILAMGGSYNYEGSVTSLQGRGSEHFLSHDGPREGF